MCTGVKFNDTDGNMFWGRNLDWNSGYGEFPIVMPKGFKIASAFGDDYESPHAMIGMGILNEGYPLFFNCGNDAGLAVGGLNFPGYAEFEKDAVSGKTNVAAYEFPVWVASNFTSVKDAKAALENVAIVGKAPAPGMPVSLLHWMIADAEGSIIIEYKADGMHIYDDTVDVLTNQPPFDWHMENLRNYMTCNGSWPGEVTWDKYKMTPFGTGSTMRGIPGDTYSTSRFVKAAFINAFHPQKESEKDNVMRMFHTLGNVSFVEGCAEMADGTYEITIYSDCFSAKTGNYYFNTYDNPAIGCAKLSDYASADPSACIKAKVYYD